MLTDHLRLGRLGLLLAIAALVVFAAAPAARADEDEEDPNEACLVCHGDPEEVEKGLLIVHTGPGKGKSSSAFGMARSSHDADDALEIIAGF